MDDESAYLLKIYAFSESPFETVTAQVYSSSFKFTSQVYSLHFRINLIKFTPHLKLSFTAEHILAELCLEWEPIWNSHFCIKMVTGQVYCLSLLLNFQVLKFHVYSSSLPPIWNCHSQQNMYWLSYVWCENPFETVIFITPLHCVIWCWAIGEVSHTFITYENEAIDVNFKFFVVFVVLMISCCCYCACRITHGQQQQAEQQQQKNENKKIHVNWSFCSDSYSY